MKRIIAVAGMIVAIGIASRFLGGTPHAEGPSQGGLTPASAQNSNKSGGGGTGNSSPALPVEVAPAQIRSVRHVLDISGSLKTDDDVQIGTRIAGKVARVTVKEGDRVERGQVLVQLDDRELRAQLARAQAQHAAAQARLSLAQNDATRKNSAAEQEYRRLQANLTASDARVQQAETNTKLTDSEIKTRIQTAEANLSVARERLKIARESTRKQELRQAQLSLEQSRAQLEQARVDMENQRVVLERRRNLFRQDAVAKEEVDEAERRFKQMEASVRVAQAGVSVQQQQLELAMEGSRPEEVRVAEEQVRAAEQALQQARADEARRQVARDEVQAAKAARAQIQAQLEAAKAALVQTEISEDEVNAARASIRQAQADMAYYQAQLADLVIRAPVSGVITRRQVNVGEMVTTSSALMNLVATDSVYLEAVVPELDVTLLRSGAPAKVQVEYLPGKQLDGTVREVIPVADSASRQFRVRVAVLAAKSQLPPGGYASATVHVGTRQDVVTIPKEAIYTEAGDKYVWLAVDGEDGKLVTRRRIVQVGLVDERLAEITGGLKEGERVITSGSPAIIDGTAITTSGK